MLYDVVALLDPEVQLTLERVAEVQGSCAFLRLSTFTPLRRTAVFIEVRAADPR